MRGKITKNKGLSLLLAVVIMITGIIMPVPKAKTVTAAASTSYITVNAFIEDLVQEIGLKVDTTALQAALTAKIVKEGEFTDYTVYINRTDAAVLINRADEYMHGDKVDKKLLTMVMDKRISDIKKIDSDKREAVAKVYAKGIIVGFSNGKYTQDRAFKGNDYISASGAKIAIKLIKNTSGRNKLSPDGQMIRTTNLPKNAKKFEYILANFPNKFYERKFLFMFSKQFQVGTLEDEYYDYPVEMRSKTFRNWYDEWPLSEEMDKYLYDWADLAEKYLNYLFNVDYRTVNDEWAEGLGALYASSLDEAQDIKDYYIKPMKKNKVIVESSIISVEPSVFYQYDNFQYMRAYVRYRITASDINVEQNKLLCCQYPFLKNLKNGQWREGIFDIGFDTNNGSTGDGSDFAIDTLTPFDDSMNVSVN